MKKLYQITGILLVVYFVATPNLFAQEVQKNENYTIENCVNEYSPDKSEITKSGHRFWFVDKDFVDGRTIKLSAVKPNSATHPPHTHSQDEFFFILEGKAEFFLDGKTKIVGPYTSLYCPANVSHGISNAGEVGLKYLVIKKLPQ